MESEVKRDSEDRLMIQRLHWTLESCVQSGPEKIAHGLMHHHSATVCSGIAWFLPKCSGKIIVYQLMQNLYQLVKYYLINIQN